MLTLSYLREHTDEAIRKLKIKQFDAGKLIEEILALDSSRRKIQAERDGLQSEANQASWEIGKLFAQGKQEEGQALREKVSGLKERIRKLETGYREANAKLQELLVQLPNVPHESVPEGKSAEDNRIVREGNKVPDLAGGGLPHWDLAAKFGIIDFKTGNKITGSGFPLFAGQGARLKRALIRYFLEKAGKAGYREFIPPLMVNADSAFGTGQLPDKEGQMYRVPEDDLYLVPTAEVPLTNIYRDVILNEDDLPVKLTAYTPCFRREAGSYGKDVRGLNRVHQFDKVEIVQIAHPNHSYEVLEEMVAHVEHLVRELELPYRIVQLCGGDLSFTSALTYDFEVYSAAQGKWLEVSSVSNFESYQANRLKLRFRDNQKRTRLAHTLNGSALALPRIVAALLENNQQDDVINLPQVLHPYFGDSAIRLTR